MEIRAVELTKTRYNQPSRAGSGSEKPKWKHKETPQTKRLPGSQSMKTKLPPQESPSGTRISWRGKENARPGEWSSNWNSERWSAENAQLSRQTTHNRRWWSRVCKRSQWMRNTDEESGIYAHLGWIWPQVGNVGKNRDSGNRKKKSVFTSVKKNPHLTSWETLNLSKYDENLSKYDEIQHLKGSEGLMGKEQVCRHKFSANRLRQGPVSSAVVWVWVWVCVCVKCIFMRKFWYEAFQQLLGLSLRPDWRVSAPAWCRFLRTEFPSLNRIGAASLRCLFLLRMKNTIVVIRLLFPSGSRLLCFLQDRTWLN